MLTELTASSQQMNREMATGRPATGSGLHPKTLVRRRRPSSSPTWTGSNAEWEKVARAFPARGSSFASHHYGASISTGENQLKPQVPPLRFPPRRRRPVAGDPGFPPQRRRPVAGDPGFAPVGMTTLCNKSINWSRRSLHFAFHPSDEDLSMGTPAFHPSDEDLSLGTPAFHPSDEDLSLGTPVRSGREDTLCNKSMTRGTIN